MRGRRISELGLAALAAGLVGCAHATVPSPAKPLAAAPKASEDRNPNGDDVFRILRDSGLPVSTLEMGKRWRVAVARPEQTPIQVDVVYSTTFTVVLGKLFNLPEGDDAEIYRAIAERNYDLEQMKLSVNQTGEVFASFEVPTRILDRRELMENIVSLAAALDAIGPNGTAMSSPLRGIRQAPRPSSPPASPDGSPPMIQLISAPGGSSSSVGFSL